MAVFVPIYITDFSTAVLGGFDLEVLPKVIQSSLFEPLKLKSFSNRQLQLVTKPYNQTKSILEKTENYLGTTGLFSSNF